MCDKDFPFILSVQEKNHLKLVFFGQERTSVNNSHEQLALIVEEKQTCEDIEIFLEPYVYTFPGEKKNKAKKLCWIIN